MTWVKICGITNLEDALTAVEAGADALGFVFYEKSPRSVDPETARQIVSKLPEGVQKLGVFVGSYPEDLVQLVLNLRLTATQLHLGFVPGSNDAAYGSSAPRFGRHWSLPASMFIEHEDAAKGLISSFARLTDFMQSHSQGNNGRGLSPIIFLDAGTAQQPGGTGTTFDWHKAVPAVEEMRHTIRVVVAGGLNPTNVGEAMRTLKPWGVDVSSGVEASPGKKDPEKVRAFIAAVREEDAKH
ncbi:MAG TPA: phosphoribosylanthranilate isomerase [Terriglobales bacterium]|nr:phosphoribosylanthranilate isomerase [Terriglobales bacterium]